MFSALRNVRRQLGVRLDTSIWSFLRGVLLGGAWQLYKRTLKWPLLVKTYRNTYFLLRPNCITSSRFVYERRPDWRFVSVLALFGGEDVAFVDVGANVGLYSVLLCGVFPRGWLFEPNPVAAEMARQNLALNSADMNFKVIHAVADAEHGSVEFPALDSPLPTAQVGQRGDNGTITVSAVRLDSFLRADSDYVMKVDAEGMDLNVIRGLEGILAKRLIRACLFECHTDKTLQGVMEFVSPFGYSLMDERYRPYLDTTLGGRSRDLFVIRDDLLKLMTAKSTN